MFLLNGAIKMGVKILNLKSLNYDEELRVELEQVLGEYRLTNGGLVNFLKKYLLSIGVVLVVLMASYFLKFYIVTVLTGLFTIFYFQYNLNEYNKTTMFNNIKNITSIINRIINNKAESSRYYILLDTTILFDSRIIDLLTEPVLKDRLCIPRFVMEELVTLSKKSSSMKSGMAKEALSHLEAVIKNNSINVIDEPRNDVIDVDIQLINLAERVNGIIFTNDKDLSVKAIKRGIMISSLTELAESMEEPFGIGEIFDIKIVKRGKERGEGIGYMRDGTTVIVYGADSRINQNAMVKIENIVKSPNGRTLFASINDDDELEGGSENLLRR